MSASTDPTISSAPKSVTRLELYDLAWQEPMLRVAERFGVSSSYLTRVFTELRVPRPARGYWAQREFGKSPPKPELPPARPGDLTEWRPGAAVGTAVRAVAKATRAAEAGAASKMGTTDVETKTASRALMQKIKDGRTIAGSRRHELLTGVRPLFLKTRKVENGILRPFKRLLVDVMASEAKLGDALDAAQVLFDALNQRGFHVGFAPVGEYMPRAEVQLLDKPASRNYHHTVWTPERPTVVYVGETAIGLTLFEMTEEVEVVYINGEYLPVRDLSEQQLRRYTGIHHWRAKEEHASGRLCLQAYCPSGWVKWSRRWQETNPGEFPGVVPSIIKELEAIAPDLARQLEEAKLRAEEERRRWEEERRRQETEAERLRREKARQESVRDLLAAIASWDEARRVRDYFGSVEAEVGRLPEEEAVLVRERLRLARELVGEFDPLELLKGWKAPGEQLSEARNGPR